MNYRESMEYLEDVAHLGSVPGLERIRTLMEYLGNPEKNLRFVHVTGTNGKGSTCACLTSILAESGFRTGLFTSPFFTKYNEEISINGVDISDDEFAETLTTVRQELERMLADGHGHPTVFEITLALAFRYFYDQHCDIVVLEVGLGGLGDATNIIGAPEIALITPISLDHTAFLGSTLAEIAREKSGIIKTGCIALTAHQPAEVLEVIERACAETSVPLYTPAEYATCTSYSLEGQVMDVPAAAYGCAHDALTVKTPLLGSYQHENISLAIAAAQLLRERGLDITDDSIAAGIASTKWPGRFELIHQNPAIVIDGAHNADGIESLHASVERYFGQKKLFFITGILADKDYRYMMNRMLPHASEIYTITVPNPRALPADDLAECIRELGGEATPCESIESALETVLAKAAPDDVILVFGSLYYIGCVRDLVVIK